MKKLYVAQVMNANFDVSGPVEQRYVYSVEKVTNSTMPQVRDKLLTAQELDVYCESEDWDVTITHP